MGDTVESLSADLALVQELRESQSLSLNSSKCEIIITTQEIPDRVSSILPGASTINPGDSIIFGAPLGPRTIDVISDKKGERLLKDDERNNTKDTEDALFLLIRCFTLMRLKYFLKASPFFSSDRLREYDKAVNFTLEKTLNLP